MPQGMASNYTVVPASTTTTIEGGGTVYVYGIITSASANAVLTINDGSGTLIQTVRTLANDSKIVNIIWYARTGVQLVVPANMTATILHSKAGA